LAFLIAEMLKEDRVTKNGAAKTAAIA